MQAPYPSYPPPSTPSLSQSVTKVELNIKFSCRNLRDKEFMSKSDPMAVVMILKDGNWLEVTVNASYYLIFL